MGRDSPARVGRADAAPVLGRFRTLRAQRRSRDDGGVFTVEGVRNFIRCVDHKVAFDTIIVCRRLLQSVVAQKLLRQVRAAGASCITVSPEQFRSISALDRASGIAAIVRVRRCTLGDLNIEDGCVVTVHDVRSPGNLGTMLRTMQAVGSGGLVITGNADPYDPAVVRASMGALLTLPVVRTTCARLGSWALTHNIEVIGACPGASMSFQQASYEPPSLLVIGSERAGLNGAQRQICTSMVRIPMRHGCDSLNLGVAGSLLLYESIRGLISSNSRNAYVKRCDTVPFR